MLCGCAATTGAAIERPNVLILYADDLGYNEYNELSCYGGKHVPTPNIDSLATGGMRFTQGYVSAPLCSPSRAGLMTGRYQTRFGHENNTMALGGLPLTETTIANRLNSLGYATCAIGKWHLGSGADRLPTARGFDEYFGVTGNPGSYFKPGGFIDSRVSSSVQQVNDPKFPAVTMTQFAAKQYTKWLSLTTGQQYRLPTESEFDHPDIKMSVMTLLDDGRGQLAFLTNTLQNNRPIDPLDQRIDRHSRAIQLCA